MPQVTATRLEDDQAVREAISGAVESVGVVRLDECVNRIIQAIAPHVRPVGQSVPLEDYALSEQENESLRTHLFWAADHLPIGEKKMLAHRLCQPIDKGGIVDPCDEEDSPLLKLIRSLQ